MLFAARMMTAIRRGSVALDGSGDYLTVASDANLALGSGDFTIEFWFRPASASTSVLLDFRTANGASPVLSYINTGALDFTLNGASRISGGVAASGAWHHLALSRSGTSTKLFLNGVQIGSTFTDSTAYTVGASRPVVGANGLELALNQFSGNISELRILKGVALYTGAFTPPGRPLAPISGTQLLIGASAASITDASANGYTITAAGNAAASASSPF